MGVGRGFADPPRPVFRKRVSVTAEASSLNWGKRVWWVSGGVGGEKMSIGAEASLSWEKGAGVVRERYSARPKPPRQGKGGEAALSGNRRLSCGH